MLSNPDISEANVQSLEQQIERIVTEAKGKLLSFEYWGKYRLSYPVNKNEYGVYCLARYELPEENITAAISNLQLYFRIKANDIVLRQVCKRLGKGASLEYMKPESMDFSKPDMAPMVDNTDDSDDRIAG